MEKVKSEGTRGNVRVNRLEVSVNLKISCLGNNLVGVSDILEFMILEMKQLMEAQLRVAPKCAENTLLFSKLFYQSWKPPKT